MSSPRTSVNDIEMEEIAIDPGAETTQPPAPAMEPVDDDAQPAERSRSCARSFSNFCDPNFFKSVINVKEVFTPITLKKVGWWAASAGAVAGLVTAEVMTGCFSAAVNFESTALMVFLYGVDPLVQTLNIVTAKYPPALEQVENETAENSEENEDAEDNNEHDIIEIEEDNSKIAAVIPCHLAADKIEITVRSLLRHLKPHQIFIVDNGNSETPLDNTREIVASISPEINYIWGHIGNKTFAQYIGTLAAKEKGFTIVYTSDDDMIVPKRFSFGADLLDDACKAVAYPIIATQESNNGEPAQPNLLVRFQSLEYKMSDCAKLSQARFGGVLVPHGAASLWDIKYFLKCLKKHDAIFYVEDGKLGWALKELRKKMDITAGASLATLAPTSVFGKFPNLYQQRVRSWEMGRQWYFWEYVRQVFIRPPTIGPIDWLMYKFAEIYAVYNNVVDWIRFPVFVLKIASPAYWIRFAIVIGASNLPVLAWNYIKLPLSHRKDLQSGLLDVLLFPLFKLLESAMSVGGIGRVLSVYGPNYTPKRNVKEHEASFAKHRAQLENSIREIESSMENPPTTYRRMMLELKYGEAHPANVITIAIPAGRPNPAYQHANDVTVSGNRSLQGNSIFPPPQPINDAAHSLEPVTANNNNV